ncbi:MAG: RHS repeat-associated core domain-containing protein [Verrucomicrobia bacterium]|nr:RHS repeat-associated core domain-containing protein [Verrucomicrobiota bacterium]
MRTHPRHLPVPGGGRRVDWRGRRWSRGLQRGLLAWCLVLGLGLEARTQTVPSQPPSANPYRFHGARYDPETGFCYFRNRYYDPQNGRFLQRDPVWDARNVGGQYTFAGNRPTSGFDALGLDEESSTSAGYGYGSSLGHEAGTEFVRAMTFIFVGKDLGPLGANALPPLLESRGLTIGPHTFGIPRPVEPPMDTMTTLQPQTVEPAPDPEPKPKRRKPLWPKPRKSEEVSALPNGNRASETVGETGTGLKVPSPEELKRKAGPCEGRNGGGDEPQLDPSHLPQFSGSPEEIDPLYQFFGRFALRLMTQSTAWEDTAEPETGGLELMPYLGAIVVGAQSSSSLGGSMPCPVEVPSGDPLSSITFEEVIK